MIEANVVKCPNCGANLDTEKDICDYCDCKYKITEYNQIKGYDNNMLKKMISFYSNFSEQNNTANSYAIGLCYLQAKNYALAAKYFEKAIEEDFSNAMACIFLAIAQIAAIKPFLLMRESIDKIELNLTTSLSIKESSWAYFILAITRYDYFKRKCFNISPTYEDYFQKAKKLGLTKFDIEDIYNLLCHNWQEIFKI